MKTLPCVTCNSTSPQQSQRMEREERTLQPNINVYVQSNGAVCRVMQGDED